VATIGIRSTTSSIKGQIVYQLYRGFKSTTLLVYIKRSQLIQNVSCPNNLSLKGSRRC